MTETPTLLGGRYRLLRRVAVGGMGTVWEARDEVLDRAVAVKVLHPQPALPPEETSLAAQRAMREARIAARLHHPNAVPVYDVVDVAGSPCLVMQYLPSRTLDDLIAENGPLPPATAARWGSEVAAALAAAHAVGIVHRDVKPGNVLITEDGRAMITDFGIAHAMGDVTVTTVGLVTGTPAFVAPEVARGAEAGPAADVFSLGATLYAALEGRAPFGVGTNPLATLHRAASGQIEPPQRSGPLDPLLRQMLAPDPPARPPMTEVARALAALAPDATAATQLLPVADPGTAVLPPAVPVARRRRPGRWIAAAAAALIVAGIGVALATSGGRSSPARPATTPAGVTPPVAATSTPPSSTTPPPVRQVTTHASTKPAPAAPQPPGGGKGDKHHKH